MEFFTNIFTTKWWFGRLCHSVWSLFFTYVAIGILLPGIAYGPIVYAHGEHHDISNRMKLEAQYLDNGDGDSDTIIVGHYAKGTKVNDWGPIHGRVVKVRTAANQSENGCGIIDPAIVPATGKWIALIKRGGGCDFNTKIHYSAKKSNASAVVIYDNEKVSSHSDTEVHYLPESGGEFNVSDITTVWLGYSEGEHLLRLLSTHHNNVNLTITEIPATTSPTTAKPNNTFTANNTSVLFVSISFIVLIIISLAWLVFYYIQRCRYTNAKERLSRRLANAAKKAIAKIPQRPVKYGDKELESEAEQCAVCIEPYKISDVIRVLPCRHVFHKSCVDPWLLEQRSCPMCKMDILRAFGMHLNGSQESVPQDPESGLMSSSPAIEEVERLSNSEEPGAVGGVKIVLYQHAAPHHHHRYHDGSGGGTSHQYHDAELSSEGSIDIAATTSSSLAQCHHATAHVDCTSQIVLENLEHCDDVFVKDGKSIASEPSLAAVSAGSVSLNSVHNSHDDDNDDEEEEEECNEIHSLISGLPTTRGSGNASAAGGGGSSGAKSLRKSSGSSSSISHNSKEGMDH